MNIPKDLKYTKTHEWIKTNGNTARIGITDFAQHELTDIVFAEIPKVDTELVSGKNCAVLESVKTAAEIYAPLSGRVLKANDKVTEAPELINTDPYGEGWLVEIDMQDNSELGNLLTADEYKEIIG